MSTATNNKHTHLHIFILFCIIFEGVQKVNADYFSRRYSDRSRTPCEAPEPLPNGVSIPKRRNMILQHYCNYGFKLIGDRRTQCNRGKWYGDRPICAKPGCITPTSSPENGRIQFIDPYHIGVYCSEGYDLAGNRFAYCNGTDWNRPLGSCRRRFSSVSQECDFESSDICGWVMDLSEGFTWRRVMAANIFKSFRTGPQHDHTTMNANGGHYMLMESFGATTTPVALTSPIYGRDITLKTACCFQFYYFMHGAGVGNLNVYVKPVAKMLSDIIADKDNYVRFNKSGDQNSKWNEAHFSIDEMEDDFQIVFVADGAKNHLSDIAIDDVKLMSGTECKALDNHDGDSDDSAEYEPTTTEESLFDTLSCVARCGKEANIGIMREGRGLIGLCSCDDSCIADDDCCPDYVTVCLDAPDDKSSTIPIISITTTAATTATSKLITFPWGNSSTTTTTMPKTSTSASNTTTTTTTTRRPTTTTASTTSTTRQTTKKSTTTSTTTTSKPSPTTTTKTTTRKPTLASTKRTTITTKRTTPKAGKTTPTTKATASTTKRSTTSTTTVPRIKIRINTQPVLDTTTQATIDRQGVSMDVPKKENQSPRANVTKQTWQWQPKPESNPHGSTALFFIFGLILIAIVAAVVYQRWETIKPIFLGKILQKEQNDGGVEDSNSIVANFQHEEPTQNGSNAASGSTGGNRLKLSLPSLKRSKSDKRGSTEEEVFRIEEDNDDIPLL